MVSQAEVKTEMVTKGTTMLDMFMGAVYGITLTILAVHFLYGARAPMMSSANAFHPQAYYVVGEKRFNWFSKEKSNCWGGHTWDGRCITAVYVMSSYDEPLRARDEPDVHGIGPVGCDPIRAYPKKCPK